MITYMLILDSGVRQIVVQDDVGDEFKDFATYADMVQGTIDESGRYIAVCEGISAAVRPGPGSVLTIMTTALFERQQARAQRAAQAAQAGQGQLIFPK